jgi:hypothetical protein
VPRSPPASRRMPDATPQPPAALPFRSSANHSEGTGAKRAGLRSALPMPRSRKPPLRSKFLLKERNPAAHQLILSPLLTSIPPHSP